MDPFRLLYALIVIAHQHDRLISVNDRLFIVSEGYATSDASGSLAITDAGKDKLRRKGK